MADNNYFLGVDAGVNASNVLGVVGVGTEACKNLADSQNNVFAGRGAGSNAVRVIDNSVYGGYGANYMTDSTENVLLGVSVAGNVVDTHLSVVVGANAGREAAHVQRSSLLGAFSGRVLTGDDNTLVGHGCGEVATMYRNVAVGTNAATPLPVSVTQSTVVGYAAASSTSGTNAISDNTVVVGAYAAKDAQSPLVSSVVVGTGAGALNASIGASQGPGADAVAVGTLAGATPQGRIDGALSQGLCAIGYMAAYDASAQSGGSVAVGSESLAESGACLETVALGPRSGHSYTGASCVLVGSQACGDGGSFGAGNSAVGASIRIQGNNNSLVGSSCASTGDRNSIVGSSASVTGSNNAVVGGVVTSASAQGCALVGTGVAVTAPALQSSCVVGSGLNVVANEGQALSNICIVGSGEARVYSANGSGLTSIQSSSGSFMNAYGSGDVSLHAQGGLDISAGNGVSVNAPMTVTLPLQVQGLPAITTSVPNSTYTTATFECNGRVAGRIFHPDNNTTCYGTTSDRRTKDVVSEVRGVDALDRLMRLRPVWYTFKDSPSGVARMGFLADEVQTVLPYAVDGDRDDPDKFQVLDSTAIVPLLVAALQDIYVSMGERRP